MKIALTFILMSLSSIASLAADYRCDRDYAAIRIDVDNYVEFKKPKLLPVQLDKHAKVLDRLQIRAASQFYAAFENAIKAQCGKSSNIGRQIKGQAIIEYLHVSCSKGIPQLSVLEQIPVAAVGLACN